MSKRIFFHPLFFLILALMLGSVVIIHHYATWHRVVDWADVLHHEMVAFTSFAFAVGIVVTAWFYTWGRRHG